MTGERKPVPGLRSLLEATFGLIENADAPRAAWIRAHPGAFRP